MPKLQAICTAVPPFKIEQDEIMEFAKTIFHDKFEDIERLLPIFKNTGIKSRNFSVPLDWFEDEHTLEEKNKIYIQTATDLSTEASLSLFFEAGINPKDIDCIIYINTTGLATPTIDARLINVLGLRENIKRTPIWGLGCAGGAAGLSHAYDYLLGHPTHRVLLVAVELCGLTFMRNDYSKSNFVATSLFGDGAAVALLIGDEVKAEGHSIIDVQSMFYPDSLDIMGWNIMSNGMQVVFNERIPKIVAENSNKELESFLAKNKLTKTDIKSFLFHPGGMKVLQAYIEAFQIDQSAFSFSQNVLTNHGNMSSVTVLFVIEQFLKSTKPNGSEYAVISALGPGFCSESLLMRY